MKTIVEVDGVKLNEKQIYQLKKWFEPFGLETHNEINIDYLSDVKDTLIRVMVYLMEYTDKFDKEIKEALQTVLDLQQELTNLNPEKEKNNE